MSQPYTVHEVNSVLICLEVRKPIAQCHPDVHKKHDVIPAVSLGCSSLAGLTRYENAAGSTMEIRRVSKRAQARDPCNAGEDVETRR